LYVKKYFLLIIAFVNIIYFSKDNNDV